MPEHQKQNNAAEGLVWNVISQLGLNKVLSFLVLLCTAAWLWLCGNQKQNNAAAGLAWSVISQLGLNKVLHLFDPVVQCCLAMMCGK